MSDLTPFREADTDFKRLNVWQQKSRMNSDPLYTNPLRWMRLAIYCQLSGDTPDAVHARRRKRQWTDGVQCGIGPDGNLWIQPGRGEQMGGKPNAPSGKREPPDAA